MLWRHLSTAYVAVGVTAVVRRDGVYGDLHESLHVACLLSQRLRALPSKAALARNVCTRELR